MDAWIECSCSSCNSDVIQNLKKNGYSSNALEYQALQDHVLPPPWYDRDKFLRGQQFFHINFLSIFVSNLIGLMSILHIHGIISVLMKTGKSSTVSTAARRYLSTLRHLYVWYSGDCFLPGSNANKSILLVRKFHLSSITSRKNFYGHDLSNSKERSYSLTHDSKAKEDSFVSHEPVDDLALANNKMLNCQRPASNYESHATHPLHLSDSSSSCAQQASQVDMVATLWAFCALPCVFWRELGVAESSLPLVPDFLHFWRTIGYLMGVKDCFNICAPMEESCTTEEKSSSVTWTNDHFLALQHQLLVPAVSERKLHSCQMENTLLHSVQRLVRVVEPEAFSCFAYRLLGLDPTLLPRLNFHSRCVFWLQTYVLGTVLHLPLLGPLLRLVLNGLLLFSITYSDNAYIIAAVDAFLVAVKLPLHLCSLTFSWLRGTTKLVQQKLVSLLLQDEG